MMHGKKHFWLLQAGFCKIFNVVSLFFLVICERLEVGCSLIRVKKAMDGKSCFHAIDEVAMA